jgi:hypothetical protein
MQHTSPGPKRRFGAIAIAAFLVIFGAVSVVQGLDGRSTVHGALRQEGVVGAPHMNPAAIAPMAKQAGLRDVELPTCSVAGKKVDDGAAARCFAQYMRIDALMASRGKTYAQLPAFATKDGKGTNDLSKAQQGPDGQPLNHPTRNVWITATALSTALNTSYMAEQISLFGIAVGAAFLLVGLVFAVVAIGGARIPSLAAMRGRRGA